LSPIIVGLIIGPCPEGVPQGVRLDQIDIRQAKTGRICVSCYDIPPIRCLLNGIAHLVIAGSICLFKGDLSLNDSRKETEDSIQETGKKSLPQPMADHFFHNSSTDTENLTPLKYERREGR
jgi:hypothetical protein